MEPIIIIGTGLAGYQLAREFRKLDQTTPLMLITQDDGRFYSKPLLSTALTNKKDIHSLTTSTAETMSAQLNATIQAYSEVTAIIPQKKIIFVNNKEIIYSKLVLACGAEVIKPHLQGNAVHEVVSVNHLHDYATFQELLQNKKNITILGAGLIGCEFANDLSNAGYQVSVVALGKAPLDLLIPEEIGQLLQRALEQNNVHFHFNCTVNHVDKNNSCYDLTLSNGNTLQTELILSAIGLRPRISLAKTANLQINRGILVNRFLETSIPDIYALGDCAEVEGHVLPFITPLLNAGRALAKTLANEKTAVDYPAMPVLVKTPAHPLAVCPPPKNIEGEWKIETENENVRALFYDTQNQLQGFVLTNEAVKERMSLAKQMPGLF
jgi:rubredoxin---NAD+ reductase